MSELSVPILMRGSAGEYVRVVQRILNLYSLAGVKPLDPDAKFGSHTEAAVKAFQHKHHIDPDGIVGPITRSKLFPFGTYQSLIYVTRPSGDRRGGAQLGFALDETTADPAPGNPPGQLPPVSLFPPHATFLLSPLAAGGSVSNDHIPGFPDELPFPDLPSSLPGFPTPPPLFPPLTLPPLPPIFPNKIQLAPGNQVAVPKLTLLGPNPKTNPFVDTFVTTVRGVWPVAHNRFLHEIQGGGTLSLPVSQPISDRKNTTYQFFVQGLSPDLLINRNMWLELHIIGKAAVTIPKDGSSTTGAVSAQIKASVKLDDHVSASVVTGPQLAGAFAGGKFSLSVTPVVINAGVTVSF
ncbi:MAG: peptidoglycan-binding protein [Pseudomonadota bacterium]|nr:peptidoglycan-binding protein [Pseudomonadota bacterium]